MRVMLQNSETGLFYAGPDHWTSDTVVAIDFESIPHAVETYKHERVAFASIMVLEGPSLGKAPISMGDEDQSGIESAEPRDRTGAERSRSFR